MPSDAALAPVSENYYGFELGCVVRDNIVCEPGNVNWAGRDHGNSKNSFAQLMQLHGMLENTVLSLPFLEVHWYVDQATETPFYICSEFQCLFFWIKATYGPSAQKYPAVGSAAHTNEKDCQYA